MKLGDQPRGIGIGIGLEYWLCNDLLGYSDDSAFVRRLMEDAPAVLGRDTEPRMLLWAIRVQNYEAARVEYERRFPTMPSKEAKSVAAAKAMPLPSTDRQRELRARLSGVGFHTEKRSGVRDPESRALPPAIQEEVAGTTWTTLRRTCDQVTVEDMPEAMEEGRNRAESGPTTSINYAQEG